MRYGMVTALFPLPEDGTIPAAWFAGVPESTIFAADKLPEGIGQDELPVAGEIAGLALQRKIDRDGWPK